MAKWMVYDGLYMFISWNIHERMDDNQGQPYFRKPPQIMNDQRMLGFSVAACSKRLVELLPF